MGQQPQYLRLYSAFPSVFPFSRLASITAVTILSWHRQPPFFRNCRRSSIWLPPAAIHTAGGRTRYISKPIPVWRPSLWLSSISSKSLLACKRRRFFCPKKRAHLWSKLFLSNFPLTLATIFIKYRSEGGISYYKLRDHSSGGRYICLNATSFFLTSHVLSCVVFMVYPMLSVTGIHLMALPAETAFLPTGIFTATTRPGTDGVILVGRFSCGLVSFS